MIDFNPTVQCGAVNGDRCGYAESVGRIEPMLFLPELQPPIECSAQPTGCA